MMQESDTIPRRVLVLAYYFPPMGLSGVQRTLKFVKYLPKFGWHPTVLTVEPRGYYAKDESLLHELEGRDVRVVRTPLAGPSRLLGRKEIVKIPPEWMRKVLTGLSDTFFIPDNKIGWKRRAVARALELHAETPFDLIFATAPPFTDFLIGARIKRVLNRPLVFDYRDPWVDYPFKFYFTPFHKMWNAHLERKALRASSHIVTTSRRVKEILIRRYRFLTYHDIDIISQGFDPEDYPRGASASTRVARKLKGKADRMTVAYAGVFWEDRVPDYFLQALHELIHERPKLRGHIEAVFIGNFREENMKLVKRLGLTDSVRVTGYLPHQECVRELLAADVLWMISGDDVGTPGKLYEYIGARKPILGCVPEGYLRSTVLEAGGTAVAPDDVEGIKKALISYYESYERRELKGPTSDVVDRYDRVALTGGLVKLFESLMAP
jgi:glycosyltransferase involved in cell wall biosynthesis